LAQQVKEVIPEAVKTQTDVVPNIFSVASCCSNVITFHSNILINNNMLHSKLCIYDIYGNRDLYEVIGITIDTNSVVIDRNVQGENVFVYGSQVHDFHQLDKSYIFTLNVCALQILSNKISQLENTVSSLTSNIALLEDKLQS
jgi:hypothetical protein